MTVGSNLLHFTYDASGTPMSVLYNGTTYYYATNIQGDVIAILDANGTAVVEYAYDAWGNLISTTGSMATTLGVTNPLRYRAYVFDSETNLYYLSTRYYNPEVGRFINADDTAFVGITGTLTSFNLFAYCENNPVILVDSSGQFGLTAAVIATGAIVGGLLGAFNAAATGGNILESAIEGALTGLLGSACGILITNPITAIALAAAGGTVIDFTVQATSQIVNTGTFNFDKVEWYRTAKTAIETGAGTAIPKFGNPEKVATDAFGTALMWAEGSTLITATDVIITNVAKTVTTGARKQSGKRLGVPILDRKLLLT